MLARSISASASRRFAAPMVEHHKIRYSRIRADGARVFEPTPKMQSYGFAWLNLGPESPEARVKAWALYEEWIALRKGPPPSPDETRHVYSPRSVGWAWERYRRTDAWKAKSPATRKKDWDWAWKWLEPAFADMDP